MEDTSYLVIDSELESLFLRLGKQHPEGSKDALKIVLKTYLKLAEGSRRRGVDPILSLQELVERITSGDLYRTTKDKIDHLDTLLEKKEDQVEHLENSAVLEEIREIKNTIRKMSGTASRATQTSGLSEFNPSDAAKLITVEQSGEIKKGENYQNLRKKGKPHKKINF